MRGETTEQVDERSGSGPDHWQKLDERRQQIASVRERMNADRGFVGRQIDTVGELLSRPKFFAAFLMSTIKAQLEAVEHEPPGD